MKFFKLLILSVLLSISTNISSQEVINCNTLRECLYVPNSFTPNNDSYNDVFCISFQDSSSQINIDYSINILNKNGEIVFASNDIFECWNGSHRGGSHYIQNDIYTYIITIRKRGESLKVGGHIVVIR